MTSTRTPSAVRLWLQHYGRATFVSWDARLAAVALVLTAVVLTLSEGARASSGTTAGAALGICAGLLGVILGAMAIVTAFVTPTFVALIGDLREALTPFSTTAVIAATGLLVSLAALVAAGPAAWWLVVMLMSIALAMTTWTVVGTVQLVFLVIYFSTIRGRELTTLLEAERIRTARRQAR